MPGLEHTFLNNVIQIDLTVRNKKIKYPVFVETGTADGYTTFQMEPFFDVLYTVEVKKEF